MCCFKVESLSLKRSQISRVARNKFWRRGLAKYMSFDGWVFACETDIFCSPIISISTSNL